MFFSHRICQVNQRTKDELQRFRTETELAIPLWIKCKNVFHEEVLIQLQYLDSLSFGKNSLLLYQQKTKIQNQTKLCLHPSYHILLLSKSGNKRSKTSSIMMRSLVEVTANLRTIYRRSADADLHKQHYLKSVLREPWLFLGASVTSVKHSA